MRAQRIAFLEMKLKKKDEVLAELMEEHVALKKSWGDLKSQWVPHDTRDQVIDFVRRWNERTEMAAQKLIRWRGVASSKFYDWRARYGKVNAQSPRRPGFRATSAKPIPALAAKCCRERVATSRSR